jgi:hypothetical protein
MATDSGSDENKREQKTLSVTSRNSRGHRRSEVLLMFNISLRTCRSFTLAEVLIMAAMNVQTSHPTSANGAEGHGATARKQ